MASALGTPTCIALFHCSGIRQLLSQLETRGATEHTARSRCVGLKPDPGSDREKPALRRESCGAGLNSWLVFDRLVVLPFGSVLPLGEDMTSRVPSDVRLERRGSGMQARRVRAPSPKSSPVGILDGSRFCSSLPTMTMPPSVLGCLLQRLAVRPYRFELWSSRMGGTGTCHCAIGQASWSAELRRRTLRMLRSVLSAAR